MSKRRGTTMQSFHSRIVLISFGFISTMDMTCLPTTYTQSLEDVEIIIQLNISNDEHHLTVSQYYII